MADRPIEQGLSAPVTTLLWMSFTLADLTRVRREVEAVSRQCLVDDRIEDWITAVNELVINVIRHGGGRGAVRLLLLDDRLTCEVTDHGSGFNTADYVSRTERPSLSDTGGMGLWMVGQMADFLLAASGPAGSIIRITPRTATPSS